MVSRLSGGQEIEGSTPFTLTMDNLGGLPIYYEASPNGRAVVLHTTDGGSIPSASTIGPWVCRLRRHPVTVENRVQFPKGSPLGACSLAIRAFGS